MFTEWAAQMHTIQGDHHPGRHGEDAGIRINFYHPCYPAGPLNYKWFGYQLLARSFFAPGEIQRMAQEQIARTFWLIVTRQVRI